MGHGVWIASHVLFAHPGSFACRHGEDDNEGVSSSGRALPRSTPNHETIQISTKERPSVEGIERKRSEGYRCVLFKGCVDYQCDVLVSVGDGSDKGVPSRQAECRKHRPACRSPVQNLSWQAAALEHQAASNVNKPVEPPQLQTVPVSPPKPQRRSLALSANHRDTMSAEKRPASDDPSGQLVVKRQNLGERALARANASGSSALVQSVRFFKWTTYTARLMDS